ncbi:hypothetical protein NMY22_g17325 [Coprinellus aureogranulatus]|nr:hypothetical protein NMY22_g17325 [Coprinellus aureogranulatus]
MGFWDFGVQCVASPIYTAPGITAGRASLSEESFSAASPTKVFGGLPSLHPPHRIADPQHHPADPNGLQAQGTPLEEHRKRNFPGEGSGSFCVLAGGLFQLTSQGDGSRVWRTTYRLKQNERIRLVHPTRRDPEPGDTLMEHSGSLRTPYSRIDDLQPPQADLPRTHIDLRRSDCYTLHSTDTLATTNELKTSVGPLSPFHHLSYLTIGDTGSQAASIERHSCIIGTSACMNVAIFEGSLDAHRIEGCVSEP